MLADFKEFGGFVRAVAHKSARTGETAYFVYCGEMTIAGRYYIAVDRAKKSFRVYQV